MVLPLMGIGAMSSLSGVGAGAAAGGGFFAGMNPFVASALVQGIGSIANFMLGGSAADAQVEFQERRARDMAKAVGESNKRQMDAMAARTVDRDIQMTNQLLILDRQFREAVGATRAGAGAAGVQGDVVETAVSDFGRQQLMRMEIARRSREAQRTNTELELQAMADRGNQQIRQALGGPVQTPSLMGTLFQIGTQTFSTLAQSATFDPVKEQYRFNLS